MKIAMAQINPTVGDLYGNTEKIKSYITKAKKQGADIVAFPELAITGYPPQDLLFDKEFVKQNKEFLSRIVDASKDITVIVGFVDYDEKNLYNAAAVINNGKLIDVQYKTLLPSYDVFDEKRYFKPAEEQKIIEVDNVKLGVNICEDLWDDDYDVKVIERQAAADLIINLSASPFFVGKRKIRSELVKKHSLENKLPIFYVNLIGGQDELIFDGQSMAYDIEGKLIGNGKPFEEDLVVVDLDLETRVAKEVVAKELSEEEQIHDALVLGVRDYLGKNGFEKVIIGLSGGIDSAVTCALATEALGKENVIGLAMPSAFSSKHSVEDAKKLAENLDVEFHIIPIQESVDVARERFSKIFRDYTNGVTLENRQARERGMILMEVSNDIKNSLVLSTGNKTEAGLGYCTLYGDMCGGVAVIGDLNKLKVYALADYINRDKEIIPKNTIIKKPSAELAEGQFDPFDYKLVSPLVDDIIENNRTKQELIDLRYDEELVIDILKKIKIAEFKRRQAPLALKITEKAFGAGRRMPITNKFPIK